MLRVAIIGASGYTGGELLRILGGHPSVQISAVTSEKSAGKPVDELFPHLSALQSLTFERLNLEKISHEADFFFLALPHTQAMTAVAFLYPKGLKIVDLSADFRLKDPEVFQLSYQAPHSFPEGLKTVVYGLPELHRKAIQKASFIANPGCFPTGAILGLTPALKKSMILSDEIIIDAKSGISGAGRSPTLSTHFPEINESVMAYNVTQHRHRPEINQELSALAVKPVQVCFVPHLVPVSRGILTTIYASLHKPLSGEALQDCFSTYYKNEPFVRVLPHGKWPGLRNVRGTNVCEIGISSDPDTGKMVVVTAIDNLVKGASGQAVQNMNLMMGYDEGLGLKEFGLFP